jgi:hypothetical protein
VCRKSEKVKKVTGSQVTVVAGMKNRKTSGQVCRKHEKNKKITGSTDDKV